MRERVNEALLERFCIDHWAIHTTSRCQHRCVYCFEGDRRTRRDVPLEEARQLIDRAAGATAMVVFMGAEPTMNPHLPELIRHAARAGLIVGCSTNALRFSEPGVLAACCDAGLKALEVSFPYPDAATYHAITGAPPRGYERLLRALSNIDALNAARRGDEIPVCFNVPLSVFNLDGLGAIVDTLRARCGSTPFVVTLLRLLPGQTGRSAGFERSAVPLRSARRAIEAFARERGGDVPLRFRGFPLCALPGAEHLDADLWYRVAGTVVRHNFAGPGPLREMFPIAAVKTAHPFNGTCLACALEPFCCDRRIFVDTPPCLDNAPVPHAGPAPRQLRRFVGRAVAAVELEWREEDRWCRPILERVARRRRPRGLLPGRSIAWWPEAPDTIRLDDGRLRHAVRLTSRRVEWTIAEAARDGALASERAWAPLRELLLAAEASGASSRARRPPGAGLPELLEALRAVERRCEGDDVPAPPASRSDAGDAAPAVELVLSIDLEAARPGAALASEGPAALPAGALASAADVLGPWLREIEELLDRVARTARPAAGGERCGLEVVPPNALVLRGLEDGAPPRFRVFALSREGGPGFLCRGLRLCPDERFFARAEGILWLKAIVGVLAADGGPRWTEAAAAGSFAEEVWRAFGPLLLPRVTRSVAIDRGEVRDDLIRLRVTSRAGDALELFIAPADRTAATFARTARLALSHSRDDGALPPAVASVAHAFARRLTGAAGERLERAPGSGIIRT